MSIIYIQPDVQSYYLLDYHKQDEIEKKGRVAAAAKFKVCLSPCSHDCVIWIPAPDTGVCWG